MFHLSCYNLPIKLWWTAIFEPVEVGKSYIPQKKPWIVKSESSFDIGSSSVMRGSRWVLLKVLLFQLYGVGQSQDDATPSFFPDSKSFILWLSNKSHLFLNCFGRGKEGEGIVYTSYRASTVLGGPKHMATPVWQSQQQLRLKMLFFFLDNER